MAHLLLMYQYMRAKREVNELTAKSFKFSSLKERIKKNITKTEKYYTDAKARIASQAKRMMSAGSVFFQNQAGLGAGAMGNFVNPYSMMSGNNAFITNMLSGYNNEEIIIGTNSDGTPIKATLEGANALEMMQAYNMGQLSNKDENGNYAGKYNENQVKAFMAMLSGIQQQQYQRQQWVQNANANFQQNVSIWEEAMNAQLEAEQDAALEPLNYEETMIELEETQTKTELEEKKQEVDNIKQELSQRVKEDAVSFGLA